MTKAFRARKWKDRKDCQRNKFGEHGKGQGSSETRLEVWTT